jgi:CRP/FNR family transcriptional regulator, cyclic AMP receptor protein
LRVDLAHSGTKWLDRQPEDFREKLLSFAQTHPYSAQTPISHMGDEPQHFIGVLEGCVELTWAGLSGESTLLHLFWPGDWIGEYALITGQFRRGSLRARTKATVAFVQTRDLGRMLQEQPGWWKCLAELAADRAGLAADCMVDLMHRRPDVRCIAVLLRLAGSRVDDEVAVDEQFVPLSQEELAVLANLSRNSVGTVLRQLRRSGLVDVRYGGVVIRSMKRLRAHLLELTD